VPLVPVVYAKGDIAWYHKVPQELARSLTLKQMEQQPMVLVRVVQQHQDDFPNIYYTVQIQMPPRMTTAAGAEGLVFEHEKQTDAAHLSLRSKDQTAPQTAPASGAGRAGSNSGRGPGAARHLQETLAAMGAPIPIKVCYSSRELVLTIGSLCSVAQVGVGVVELHKRSVCLFIMIPYPNLVFSPCLHTRGLVFLSINVFSLLFYLLV
jgi:hypothetical protein